MNKVQMARRKSDEPDVPADNPEGTMDRFREGLRRVLVATKCVPLKRIKRNNKTRTG